MDWIDKVELACALVLGAVLIVMVLHFSYSVSLDIRQAVWWERCRDVLQEWAVDMKWFFMRMIGQVSEDE